MSISVLRLGHRIFRDQRISSHCFLVARALGATQGYYTGQRDQDLEQSLEKAGQTWGGSFPVQHLKSEKQLLKEWKGKIVHLTVYGLPFQEHLQEISDENLLIIVGGEKVPGEIYKRAHLNLSVGGQPHSEVAALGVLLYEVNHRSFPQLPDGRLQIIPQERGKKVIKTETKS